jgi:hypothetical protein
MSAAIFFSMLGVSQRLTEIAFDETLVTVLSAPAGSEIAFSFVPPDHVLPPDDVGWRRHPWLNSRPEANLGF